MLSQNSQKVAHGEARNEPKIAISFHRNSLKYYGVAYLLVLVILYLNFDS